MNITTRTTLATIANALREDGYDPALAPAVKAASRRGALIWTRDRLTTTDASRLDLRPL
jgi:hypothetical protein